MTEHSESASAQGGQGDVRHRSVGNRDVTKWATPAGKRLAEAHHRISTTIGARQTVALTIGIGGALALAATVAATEIYDAVADSDGVASLDRPMLRAAMRLRSPAVNGLAAGIAHVFGPVGMPILAATIPTAMSLRRGSPTPAVLTVAAGAGSLLMTIGGKDIIGRHRPPQRDAVPPFEHSPSFPSGHTLNATVVSGVVAYLLMLRQESNPAQVATAATATVTAATVGMSRVLLGAHWFTDVVVGWVLGTGWLSLIITGHRLYLTTHDRQASEA